MTAGHTLTLTLLCTIWVICRGYTLPQAVSKDQYLRLRDLLFKEEQDRMIGADMTLNADEKIVNDFIMKEKVRLIEESRLNRMTFLDAKSFFLSKPHIDNSPVYKVIQRLPKGGALHVHELALGTGRWVVKNATYRPNVYMCVLNGFVRFAIFKTQPKPGCNWTPVAAERAMATDPDAFDEMLIKNISLLATDPLTTYPTITEVWNRFNTYFDQVINLLYEVDIMKDYIADGLNEYYKDNVQYVEMRSVLGSLFKMDQRPGGIEFDTDYWKMFADAFKKDHPDFFGMKLISTTLRFFDVDTVLAIIKETIRMRQKYPDFMLGFDLVGQEDPNKTLMFYLDALLYPKQLNPPADLPYFFHAAETNWLGTPVDENLFDAILLNTTRIGHGYGLTKHPKLMEMVKERGIAIEVNPISNQILGLVKDLRNHPMVSLLADDYPIVIGSDDPGSWDSSPLSHDMYVTFMTMIGMRGDLRALKKLARNSLVYSAMPEQEKSLAIAKWQEMWMVVVKELAMEISKNENISPTMEGTTTQQQQK